MQGRLANQSAEDIQRHAGLVAGFYRIADPMAR
jgi:hypothetical protein